ncbi:SIR2-like domain-containing protein, partial [Hypoxylon crocopeplum]
MASVPAAPLGATLGDWNREALRRQREAVARLRKDLRDGKMAVCVGSGVTLYSINAAETYRMRWSGLIESGFRYVIDQASEFAHAHDRDIQRARELLALPDASDAEYLEAASRLQKILSMRPDLYSSWLRDQFHALYTYRANSSILDSLRELHRHGVQLLTTNYDDLIERHLELPALGRSDTAGLAAFNRKSLDAVLHPHGHWKDQSGIVLSARDYWDVKGHTDIHEALEHLLKSKTVIFIGSGGGLNDPNFGQLLRWIGEKEKSIGARHYILLPRGEANPVSRLSLNHVVCENRDDIGPWLTRLLAEVDDGKEEGVIPTNSKRANVHNWLSPLDQGAFLQDHSDLQGGPPQFHQSVTGGQAVWGANQTDSLVWVTGGEGFGKTMFSSSIIEATRENCRLSTTQRSRDSLAYFFCRTYDRHDMLLTIEHHDFSTFCRTVIDQLCPTHPPDRLFAPLRELKTRCTRYHPARRPTNAELQDVLLGMIDLLNTGFVSPSGVQVEPGETYLIIDGLDTIPTNERDRYLTFIRRVAERNLAHFHLLVTAQDERVIRNLLTRWGQWLEFACNFDTVRDSMREYVIKCVQDEPQLDAIAQAPDIDRAWVIDQLAESQESFRWVYTKMQELKRLDAYSREDVEEILL